MITPAVRKEQKLSRSIRLEHHADISEIILNKPQKRNALSLDMWSALTDLINECIARTATKVVIIHGGDTGHFAAGADISEFSVAYSTPEDTQKSGQIIADALMAVEKCPKPVIAAIEGSCVGGGVSLALASDIRIGDRDARFGITPAKLGLVYPAGDTRRLLQAVGPGKAKDLLFTGRLLKADEALYIGLLDRIAPAVQALDETRTMAAEIAGNSQWSTRGIKHMIAGLQAGWTDTEEQAIALFVNSFAEKDFDEGQTAFLEKRKAKFTYL